MKKLAWLLFPVMLMPTITGCKDVAHSVVSINRDNGMIDLTIEQLENLITSKQDFVIEIYTDYCSHCTDLKPILDEYVEENNRLIYRMNISDWSNELFNQYNEKYPFVFKDFYVPSIRYIKNNQLTYEVDSNNFSTLKKLSKNMESHFVDSNITMITSWSGFQRYKADHQNYVAMLYDLNNSISLTLAAKHIINKDVAQAKKNIILLNKTEIAEEIGDFAAFFKTDTISFASLVQDGEITKTIDYVTDGSELSNLISNV